VGHPINNQLWTIVRCTFWHNKAARGVENVAFQLVLPKFEIKYGWIRIYVSFTRRNIFVWMFTSQK